MDSRKIVKAMLGGERALFLASVPFAEDGKPTVMPSEAFSRSVAYVEAIPRSASSAHNQVCIRGVSTGIPIAIIDIDMHDRRAMEEIASWSLQDSATKRDCEIQQERLRLVRELRRDVDDLLPG